MYSKAHPLIPLIQMAKSLVMNPDSIVSMQTDSRVSANLNKSADSLSLALWAKPLVQAKMEAINRKWRGWWWHYGKSRWICKLAIEAYKLTNRVGGGLLALLMESVMSGDSSMSGFSFYCFTIRAHKHTCHHAKRAITCVAKENILSVQLPVILANMTQMSVGVTFTTGKKSQLLAVTNWYSMLSLTVTLCYH